jgi:hypothetical protein
MKHLNSPVCDWMVMAFIKMIKKYFLRFLSPLLLVRSHIRCYRFVLCRLHATAVDLFEAVVGGWGVGVVKV